MALKKIWMRPGQIANLSADSTVVEPNYTWTVTDGGVVNILSNSISGLRGTVQAIVDGAAYVTANSGSGASTYLITVGAADYIIGLHEEVEFQAAKILNTAFLSPQDNIEWEIDDHSVIEFMERNSGDSRRKVKGLKPGSSTTLTVAVPGLDIYKSVVVAVTDLIPDELQALQLVA
jgi:hypothetical protein